MLLEIRVLDRKIGARGNPPRIMVLKCDVCETVYERPYSKHHFDEKVHRCSLKCVYGSRDTDGLGGHGADIIELSCLVCEKPIRVRKIGNERKWGKTCSRKCYGAFRAMHPELYSESTSKMHTPDAAKKISERAIERTHSPGYIHSQTGLKRSEETRALQRQRKEENPPTGEKNGMWGREQTPEAKEKMSEAVSRRILEGRYKPYGTCNVKGYHTSIRDGKERFFKSSWEQKLMQWLDANFDVASWDYECVRIQYVYETYKRWYVPDFVVTFIDGHREMWEVKPKEFIDTEKVVLKSEAASIWCNQHGLTCFKLLTGDDLRSMSVLKL